MSTLLHYTTITKSKCRLLLAVLILFSGIGEMHAQISAYQLDQLQITPTWTALPLAGRTALYAANANVDNQINNVAIPFTFVFNGKSQTFVKISTNGFVAFGANPVTSEFTPISSATAHDGVISVLGGDIDILSANTTTTTGNNVSYATSGTSPNRIMKIQWIGARSNAINSSLDGTRILLQLWLFETTNVIEMHYGPTSPTNTVDYFSQIGLRGTDNTEFKNLDYEVAAPWPALPATMPLGTVNTARVLTDNTTSILAASNRLFRWTPPACSAPTNFAVSAVGSSGATISWTAVSPVPGIGYEYYYSTSPVAPTGATIPSGSVPVGTNTTTLTGLNDSTPYYVWVRTVCSGSSTSAWSVVRPFTTLCPPHAIPYLQYFDQIEPGYEYTVPALPPCSSTLAITGNPWQTSAMSSPDGFFDDHVFYQGNTQVANSWFFTQGVTLAASTTYRLSYMYGGSTEFTFLTNKMQVKYGTSPTPAGMLTPGPGVLLANHTSIKDSPLTNIVHFTTGAAGTYYFGFWANSLNNQGRIFLDNIEIVESVCFQPTTLTANNITGSSTLLTWDAPVPPPVNGYAYYVATVNTPPDNFTVPSGFTSAGTNVLSLTGLSANTTYYVWVRGNCGPGDFGEWSAVETFTTLNPPVYTYCTPAPTSVDGVGITNITVGSINNSTGAEPGNYGNYSNLITNVAQGASVTVAITYTTSVFNYNTKIWIDWNNNSDFSDAGENVYTGLSASTSPNTLMATFTVPAGAVLGEHRMRIGGADINTLTGYGAGQGPCYNGTWGTFEDYTVNVVVPPPALTLSITTSTQCAGTNSPLVTITNALNNYNTYTWNTASVTGSAAAGYTFNASSTNTYTLTAVQTAFPYSTNTINFTYNALALPTPIVVTPSVPSACAGGPAVQLNATGGIVGGITVYSEDFNGGAPGWIPTAAATSPPAANWIIRNNGYNPGGASGITSVSSNDATQFYISNSDAGGSGSNTSVTLTSPIFDLTGYTDASMSFYHYYKAWINGSARVEIFSGGAWNAVPILQWTTGAGATQGTPTNFALVVYNLGAYAGQSNLQIRFVYNAQWGYVWAIDNFKITGSATSDITWTPIAGLYSDAAATIPYVADTGTSVVYALPSSTTTYTASASTPSPQLCATTTNTTVTVTSVAGGTASPASQSVCGAAAPITVAGFSGSITMWQYATNAAFTVGVTNIANTASVLSSAQIGSFIGIRYYRAVVSDAGCTGYSNVVSVDFGASTTWNGTTWSSGAPDSTKRAVFSGPFSSTANIDACSVLVTAGSVIFNSGHVLHVENEVTVSGGSLTFENDASLVQVNDASVNSGSIVYRRTTTPMAPMDYTYWSSPVAAQTLFNLSPLTLNDKYFAFNTAGNNYVPVLSSTVMAAAKGYLVRAPEGHVANATYTGSFNGVPHNGVKTIPIVVAGANVSNLIGNPYPSALDADLFLLANSSFTLSTLYFWTHNTPITGNNYVGSDYALYNLVGGVGTGVGTVGGGTGNLSVPDRYIAAAQGFFIKGEAAGGNAVFNNSMRVSGNNDNFFRSSAAQTGGTLEKHRIWLNMTNAQGAFKQILAGYIETATDDVDNMFDGELLEAGNVISLYSLIGTGKYSIQGKALPFNNEDQIPLGYRTSIAGNYYISLDHFDGVFTDTGVGIYLEDTQMNTIHDLRAGNYAFATASGTFDNRFILRYTNQALGVNPNEFTTGVIVYKNDQGIHIHTSNMIMNTVRIYDVRGRELLVKTGINDDEAVISNLAAASQVLLVQITTAEGQVITRKVVH